MLGVFYRVDAASIPVDLIWYSETEITLEKVCLPVYCAFR
jgi:hypothetical protein